MSYLDRTIYEDVVDVCERIEHGSLSGDSLILSELDRVIERAAKRAETMPRVAVEEGKPATIRVTQIAIDQVTFEKKVDFEIESGSKKYTVKTRGLKPANILLTTK